MHTRIKQMLAVVAIAAVTALPVAAGEPMPEERAGGDMAVDLLLARPLGLLGIVGGAVVFVISLPFTIPSGSMDSAAEELVKKPINYTFRRPLGQVKE